MRNDNRLTILALCVATALLPNLLIPAIVRADTQLEDLQRPSLAEAKKRLTTGNRLYRLRHFEEAIKEYEAGLMKEDLPVFQYNLAQTFRQLGRYEDAIWHYERFVARVQPTGPMKDAIDGHLKKMKEELAERAKQEEIAKKAAEQALVKPAPNVALDVSPKHVAVVAREERWYADKLGWGLSGVGVIGTGVSLGLFINAERLAKDGNGPGPQEMSDALHDRATNQRVIGAIVGVVGGAALVTGILRLASYPKERSSKATTSLNVGFTTNGIVVGGLF